MRTLSLAVLLLLSNAFAFVAPARAQEYDQYLIPAASNDVAGAHGSLWTTELTIHNPRESSLTILGWNCPDPFIMPPCFRSFTVPARTSMAVNIAPRGGADGAFLYVPKDPNYPTTPMTLRVRDLSKNAESFGTEVPIARTEDYVPRVILTDVPTDPRFRATLRIYGSNEYPRDVVMRVYTLNGRDPIETRNVTLDGIVPIVFDPTPLHPGYAQVDPLSPAVRAAAARVRIEIEDALGDIVSPPPPPLWALVSITNNETQQVTTITPHP